MDEIVESEVEMGAELLGRMRRGFHTIAKAGPSLTLSFTLIHS